MVLGKTCMQLFLDRRAKYYNNCIFHNVERNFLVQTGDPTGTGKGGSSIYG
jgi:peptidyl-prolyl cis-trans isomerase-like 4